MSDEPECYVVGEEAELTGEKKEGRPLYRLKSQLGKWSGKGPLPAIGSRVKVQMNKIGWSKVRAYFTQYGWIGVLAVPKKRPSYFNDEQWETSQTLGCHVFGAELAD